MFSRQVFLQVNNNIDTLASLGHSIAQAFTDKMEQWVQLESQSAPGTPELPALSRLGSDLGLFQDAIEDFNALEAHFQADFYPAVDAVTAPGQAEPEPKMTAGDPTRPSGRAPSNFQFAAGDRVPFLQPQPDASEGEQRGVKAAESEQLPVGRVWTGHSAGTHTDRSNGPESQGISTPATSISPNRELPFSGQEPPATVGTPEHSIPLNGHTGAAQEGAPGSVSNGSVFGHMQLPGQTPRHSETIWQRPLQGLGAFASGFTPPVSAPQQRGGARQEPVPEVSNTAVPLPQYNTPPNLSSPAPDLLPASDSFPVPDFPETIAANGQKAAAPVSVHWPETPVPTVPMRPGDPAFDFSGEAEAIIQALTRQVVRDFKRYYPD